MAVSLYFGLPGCGKTTILSYEALKAVKGVKYDNVWSNVELNIPGVTYITNEVIGTYELRDGLLLIDEATLFADSRDFKNFSKGRLEYFLKHRHRNVDIILFTQQWDGVDRKIRVITDRVYYVKKGFFTGRWFSTIWKIPYKVMFPNEDGDRAGEIIMGYVKPPFFVRLFAKRVFRPPLYKYFDSWELDPLPDLPASFQPVPYNPSGMKLFKHWLNKTVILLRSVRKYRRRSGKAAFSRSLVKRSPFRRFMRRERALTSECQSLGNNAA